MKTPARSLTSACHSAALLALSAAAIIIVPVAARAACHAETHRIVLPGLHRPVARAARSFAHSFRVSRDHRRHAVVREHVRDERRFRWSLRDGGFNSNCGFSTGERRDVIGAESDGGSVLWISQDGEDWVIRDRAMIQRARGSLEPMNELGREMGRLGGEMGVIGARQGRFGAEMGRLGGRQGALAARLAVLELRQDDDDPAIERKSAEIEREMEELSRRQNELGERQDESVGGRMEELGAQMEELGSRMEQASRHAERELRELLKDAIASRRAERAGHRGAL